MTSGGTTFDKGLIVGAEMFGQNKDGFQPIVNIDLVDELVAHELIHFQQNYKQDNSLLAQCILEGSADFIGELIAGDHINKATYVYGNAHEKQLWEEFLKVKDKSNYENWLYGSYDTSKAKDLGYWMGYKITKAYYDKSVDKDLAIKEILNIKDFSAFFEASGYNGGQ